MPTHGIIDIRCDAQAPGETANQRWYNEAYTSLFRFLSSPQATANGITRIAYHTGAISPAGGGINYWNEAKSTGNNAWSVWQWASASVPFYMMVQFTTGGNFGTSPGNPGLIDGSSTNNGLGFAFALRADGGSPWVGSTRNDGTDTKAVPVWNSGSSQLFVWPRSNSISGTTTANRENMFAVPTAHAGGFPAFGSRFHLICDQEHVLLVGDEGGDQTQIYLFFGKYSPRSGSTNTVPYVSLRNASEGSTNPFAFGVYGQITASANANDGGICSPVLLASGVKNVEVTCYNDFFAAGYQPNMAVYPPGFDEFPMYVGASESPTFGGYLGHIDWMKYVWGPEPQSVSAAGDRIYLGGANTIIKLSVPWVQGVTMGVNTSRSGVIF